MRTTPSQQKVADGRGRLQSDQLLRFFRGRGNVRRGDDLRQPDERAIRRRLDLEDVERRTGDGAAVDRPLQRRPVDQLAARGVDDADAGLAAAESIVVEQMLRLGRRREVQGQIVGGGAHLVEREKLDAEPGRYFRAK